MKEKKFKILMLIISALMLVNLQCDSENPIDPTENVLMIKATSGYAASNVMHISSKIYKCALTMPNNATYDNGWWSFTIDLPNQHNAQMQIQFKDVNGNIQKFYNTLTTYYIIGKGTASGPKGSVEFNLTLSGLNLSSSYFVVNGDAQAKYQGTTANVEVKDFKIILAGSEQNPDIKNSADLAKKKIKSGVVFCTSVENDICKIVVSVTDDLVDKISAENIVKKICELWNGKGGGKPSFAQGATKKPQGDLIFEMETIIKKIL